MSLLGLSGIDGKSWLQALRSSAAVILVGLTGIILVWIVLRIVSPGTDHDLALALYDSGESDTVARGWSVVASIGDLIWVPLIFWLYVFRKSKHEWASAVIFAVAMVSAFAATDLLKFAFHLPRPFTEYPSEFTARFELPTNYAYPSGHAANAFTIVTVIWRRYRHWGIPFLALGVGTGLGVVVLGHHFPSDVIGGAFLGMIAGSFALSIAKLRSDSQTVTG